MLAYASPLHVSIERPLGHRNSGLGECVLRVREGDENIRQHLLDTFSKLFGIYGEGSRFEVAYTCNAVLIGGLDGKLSLWFGQTFEAPAAEIDDSAGSSSSRSRGAHKQVNFPENDIVRNLGDVEYLATEFNAQQFERLFQANHEESDVSVVRLVNYVYIIRYYLDNFESQHTIRSGTIQKLF